MLGNFHLSTENPNFKNILNSFDLERLIKIPPLSSPTCTDLILTNKESLFMKSTTFETGMCDFHKLTTTILRKTISKGNSKKIFYRDYKAFDHNAFEKRLQLKLTSETIIDYLQFQSIFLETLNNIPSVKMKILRYNNNPFMKKTLRKAIMTRSRLKNEFDKNISAKNWNSYKNQRNFCLKLLCQTRGGSRTTATSKMEHFVIIINGFQPLTIITKRSILDVAAALDPPLQTKEKYFNKIKVKKSI